MQKMEWVLVEFNGTRKTILREKLPEAEKMAEGMYHQAIRGGYPEQYAKYHFALRIVAEEVNGISDPI